MDQIAGEYELVHTKPTTLLVLGLSDSESSNIVNAILSTACGGSDAVHQLTSTMVKSQRTEEDLTVVELTTKELSPLNLRYFPAVKDKFNFAEYQTFQKLYDSEKSKLDDPDADLSADQRKEIEREIIYRRLSTFTPESLDRAVSVDGQTVYPLLFTGFMRQSQVEEHIVIPAAVLVLMRTFYIDSQAATQSKATVLKSIQFSAHSATQNGGMSGIQRFNILQPRGMDVDYWSTDEVSEWEMGADWHAMQRRGKIDGIVFVIDLSTYNESMVDKEGKKWNALQYALSARDKAMELFEQNKSTPKVTVLSGVNRLGERVKSVPMSVCPLFSEKEGMDHLESCIQAVNEKIDGHSSICVDGEDRREIFGKFQDEMPWFQ